MRKNTFAYNYACSFEERLVSQAGFEHPCMDVESTWDRTRPNYLLKKITPGPGSEKAEESSMGSYQGFRLISVAIIWSADYIIGIRAC